MEAALNIGENHQPISWILLGRFEHTFHIQDFQYELGSSRMLAYRAISHLCVDQVLQWCFAIIICKDGLINLGYKVIRANSNQSSPNVQFWVVATTLLNGLDGQKLVHVDTLSGQTLSSFRNNPDWRTVWNASIDPNGPHVSRETRPLQHYLSTQIMSLSITCHLVVWQSIADIDSRTPIFDVRNLNNISEALQAEVVDVCLVTKEGIIQAHSSKICDEFPGLLKDPGNAPRRGGFVWAVVSETFSLLLKLIKVMYNCYYDNFETDIVDLLVAANRLGLKKLYNKIVKGRPNGQFPIQ